MPLCSCTQPRSLNFLALCFPEAIIFLMCIKIFTHWYHLALLWKEEEKVGIPVAVALLCFYTWGLFGRSSLGEPSLNTGLWEVEWGLPAVLWCCCFICYLVLLGSRISLWISQLQMFETAPRKCPQVLVSLITSPSPPCQVSWPFNNMGLKCAGLLTHGFLSVVNTAVLHALIGWICRCGAVDKEGRV